MNFGQNIMIGLEGTELSSSEEKFIIENNIGGVTLFGRNVESPEQVWELCRQIQRLRFRQPDQAPILIGIDMEGGRVHRLKPPFTQFPALAKLGEIGSPTVAFKFANVMGAEMRAVGINLDYAPCVDVLTNPDNPVIGDRSASSDPEMVSKIGSALVRGYIKSGVLACAKHFPGHGSSSVDSHLELPVDDTTVEHLQSVEFVPFKKIFRSRIDMVMTCHVKFPQIDEHPATLSKKILQTYLREECRFRGVIVTDDLGMKAMTNHYDAAEIPVRALQAGCDLLLYCNEPESPPIAIEAIQKALDSGELDKEAMAASTQRVLDMKKSRLKDNETIPLEDALEVVNNPQHKELVAAIEAGSVPASLLE